MVWLCVVQDLIECVVVAVSDANDALKTLRWLGFKVRIKVSVSVRVMVCEGWGGGSGWG